MKVVRSLRGPYVELVDSHFKPICFSSRRLAFICGIRPGLEFTEREFLSRIGRAKDLMGAGYSVQDVMDKIYDEFDGSKL